MKPAPRNATPPQPILQLKELCTGYDRPILSLGSASVSAYPGHIIALLGRNGCGKTTLLRTIAGLLPPLKGEILTRGESIASLTRRAKAKLVAFAPTQHSPDGSIKVNELIMLARFPHQGWFKSSSALDHSAVQQAMRLTLTSRFANRAIATLSDGERQRVWLAMALAQETPILLLDEPSAFLDFPAKGNLVALLHQLARSTQRLIIYSTHDIQSALWRSDRLWILHSNTLYDSIPEEAAKNGTLNSVFGTESSVFDPHSFTFTPRTAAQEAMPLFQLAGLDNDPDALYARRVLQRTGWREANDNATNFVTISKNQAEQLWELPDGQRANSLEELANWAEQNR